MSDQLTAPHCVCRFRNADAFLIRNADRVRKHRITNNLSQVTT